MAIKGLAQAMKNLDAIDRRAVPRAAATTLNRVAESIIAKTASSVAGGWRFRAVSSVSVSACNGPAQTGFMRRSSSTQVICPP